MVTLSDLPLRQSLKGQQPYGAPQLTVPVALNVNENTHGIPDEVKTEIVESLSKAVSQSNRYPDREFTELRESLASYLSNTTGESLNPEQIWAANGSNEVLQHILQAFGGPGRSLLSFTPTYSMYPLLAGGTDTEWVPIPRLENYTLTPEYVAETLKKHNPAVAILCAPNNPTGTSQSLDVVKAAYDAFDGILIVDEAYIEFEEEPVSAVSLLAGRHRLAVSRTMSKAFAFAGVRLGYLVADPALIDALRLVRLPYHLSLLTQVAAVAALKNYPLMLQSVKSITQQRIRLAQALTDLGYTVNQSGANFLLVGGFADADSVFDSLLEQGILIRKFNIPGHLRITAGTETETTAVIEAITNLTPNHSGQSN